MSKRPVPDVLTERLYEHQAVRAWRQLHAPEGEPTSIEVLKRKRHTAVYRINGIQPDGTSIIAKWCRRETGRVERLIYAELLPRIPVPSLRLHGFLPDTEDSACWLFLEDAAGEPYSPHDVEHRAVAGWWLGYIHAAARTTDLGTQLPERELDHHGRVLHRCRTTLLAHLDRTPLPAEHVVAFRTLVTYCDAIESQWDRIETVCGVLPRTLVHGDFVTKNVRVQRDASGHVLFVFDWQYAGWGVAAPDLAQFIDKVASPDLHVYRSILTGAHLHVDVHDLQRVAACGNLLRLLDQIEWALSGLRVGDPNNHVSKAVWLLSIYAATQQPDALAVFRRSCDD
jgi:hypothetical protein